MLEAWNEPNSQYPDGKYGEESLYYEGRAVKVSLMEDPTVKTLGNIPKASFLSRLSQLAVCAGFPYVELHEDYVELGVDPDVPYTPEDQKHFIEFFHNAPPQNMELCNAYSEYFPELSLGESMPEDITAEEALGGIDNRYICNVHFVHNHNPCITAHCEIFLVKATVGSSYILQCLIR